MFLEPRGSQARDLGGVMGSRRVSQARAVRVGWRIEWRRSRHPHLHVDIGPVSQAFPKDDFASLGLCEQAGSAFVLSRNRSS